MEKNTQSILLKIKENKNDSIRITVDNKPKSLEGLDDTFDIEHDTKLGFGEKTFDKPVKFYIKDKKAIALFNGKIEIYYPKKDLGDKKSKEEFIIAKGEIMDGLKIGEWVYFFEDSLGWGYDKDSYSKMQSYPHKYQADTKESKGVYLEAKVANYKEGVLYGEMKSWQKSGDAYEEGNYVNGLKEGKWISYLPYTPGQIGTECEYKNGEEVGVRTSYHSNGKISDTLTFRPHPKGEVIRDYKNYKDGTLEEENFYKDGMANGRWKYYYESGNKKEEREFKDDEKNGEWLQWYENGNKKAVFNFKDDKKDGKCIHWYENGQIEEEESYKNGINDEPSFYWYENGQLKQEINWKDGDISSNKRWYENGQLEMERTYKDGEEITKKWDENGNEI